jgi:hypothetical protein
MGQIAVEPTDREVPDNLAMGVIRFVASKRNIPVNWEEVEAMRAGKLPSLSDDSEDQKPEVAEVKTEKPAAKTENLNVLRKLSLDDVSKEAIDKQKQALAKEKPKPLSNAKPIPKYLQYETFFRGYFHRARGSGRARNSDGRGDARIGFESRRVSHFCVQGVYVAYSWRIEFDGNPYRSAGAAGVRASY